jgi:hypothetical protein
MTEAEYDRELRRLKGIVTGRKNVFAASSHQNLGYKLVIKRSIAEAEETLRQWKLNRFALIDQK